MKVFNLQDTSFSHIEYTAPGIIANDIKWDRECKSDAPTFYTHEKMLDAVEVNDKPKYGLMLESQAILPGVYAQLPHHMHKFKTVFTHSSFLLTNFSNTKWIPGGSIWVGGSYGGGERRIYDKTKLCSMVSSDKKMCQLHRIRIALAEFLEGQNTGIDFYGSMFGKWVPIIETLQDYKFSICIENYIDDDYFTEKILNCFATGTIPVYIGAKNIKNKFNGDGIIQVSKPGEMIDAIAEFVNDDFYASRKDAIEENFNIALTYDVLEEYIVGRYGL